MNVPRGKLLTVAALFAAVAVVTATGAFTSVQADRNADVSVAGDSSAFLALEPNQNSPNGAYASLQNGQLSINLDGDASGVSGAGANVNATTEFDRVFNVTNQGSQAVGVYLTDNGTSAVTFYGNSGSSIESKSNAVTVAPGETVTIGIEVDTTGMDKSAGTILDSVTVHADASAA